MAEADNPLVFFPARGRIAQAIARLEDRLFIERRVLFCAVGIAIGLAVVLASKIGSGKSILSPDGKPACSDFCTFWVSGKFAAARVPAKVYDYPLFAAAKTALAGPPPAGSLGQYRYAYPPVFLFFTYLLGLMPYFVAFVAWTAATLALYEAAIYAILPRCSALVAALTPIVVAENILVGQNGLLSAGLIGLSLVFIERRAWLGGGLLSLLTYKPHFGVAFPLALLASRNWRAFGAAAAASGILVVAAALAFGYRTWPLFIAVLADRNASLSVEPGIELIQQSVYGLVYWAGGGMAVALLIHIAVAALAASAVGVLWAKPVPHSLRAAALCLASLTITPYVGPYDLCILSIAAAFLIKDGLAYGFLPGERAVLFLCFGGMFFLFMLIPIGPVLCGLLFCLVGRRAAAWQRNRLSVPATGLG